MARFQGICFDELGMPTGNVKVRIVRRKDNVLISETKSDEQGYYDLDVPEGHYVSVVKFRQAQPGGLRAPRERPDVNALAPPRIICLVRDEPHGYAE